MEQPGVLYGFVDEVKKYEFISSSAAAQRHFNNNSTVCNMHWTWDTHGKFYVSSIAAGINWEILLKSYPLLTDYGRKEKKKGIIDRIEPLSVVENYTTGSKPLPISIVVI